MQKATKGKTNQRGKGAGSCIILIAVILGLGVLGVYTVLTPNDNADTDEIFEFTQLPQEAAIEPYQTFDIDFTIDLVSNTSDYAIVEVAIDGTHDFNDWVLYLDEVDFQCIGNTFKLIIDTNSPVWIIEYNVSCSLPDHEVSLISYKSSENETPIEVENEVDCATFTGTLQFYLWW